MIISNEIEEIILLSSELIKELEHAIEVLGVNTSNYPNAQIALMNIKTWHNLALKGNLQGSYYPNFGIGKSDLMFGNIEDRMYQLENLYVEKIRDL